MNHTGPFFRSTAVALCSLALLAGCNRRTDTPADASGSASGNSGMGRTVPGSMSSSVPSGMTAPDAVSPGTPAAPDGAASRAGMSGSTSGMSPPSAAPGADERAAPMASAPGADASRAGGRAGEPLAAADAKFVEKAAGGGLFEVAVGQLAADKAGSPEVKAFGSMLVEQHGAANDKLAKIAADHAMTLPTAVPADKQKIIDRLSKLSGAAFDREFIQTVGLKDHRQDIADFEKASRGAKATDVRGFATGTLPTLRAHLAAAQKLGSSGHTTSKAA